MDHIFIIPYKLQYKDKEILIIIKEKKKVKET